jgi:ABC-type antimicrobial peptide transport system permease subunit
VRARTREIAIRVALGANASAVGRAIIGRALWLVGLGIAVGLIGSVLVARLVQRQLFEVRPVDVTTLLAVSAAMFLVALIAAYGPARRAARIAPAIVLKDS